MNKYTIYVYPEGDSETTYRPAEAVNHGFSWPALLLTGFWALSNRLWIQFFLTFAVLLAGDYIAGFFRTSNSKITNNLYYADIIVIVVLWILGIVYGWHGNKWRSESLKRRGYQNKGTTDAVSAKKAIEIIVT